MEMVAPPLAGGSGAKPKKILATSASSTNNKAKKGFLSDYASNCRVSDNLADSCRTLCKICGEAYVLTRMRTHTLAKHNIQITKYKEIHGPFEIIEKVFHKCYICGKLVLLDSDWLGGHIKGTHKMKEKEYKDKYCNYASSTNKFKVAEKINDVTKNVIKKKKEQKKISKAIKKATDSQDGHSLRSVQMTNFKGGDIEKIKKTEPEYIEQTFDDSDVEEMLLQEWNDEILKVSQPAAPQPTSVMPQDPRWCLNAGDSVVYKEYNYLGMDTDVGDMDMDQWFEEEYQEMGFCELMDDLDNILYYYTNTGFINRPT